MQMGNFLLSAGFPFVFTAPSEEATGFRDAASHTYTLPFCSSFLVLCVLKCYIVMKFLGMIAGGNGRPTSNCKLTIQVLLDALGASTQPLTGTASPNPREIVLARPTVPGTVFLVL